MAGEIFEFLWAVHELGYQWIEARPGASPVLEVVMPPSGEAGEVREYSPLRLYSGLFRTFAAMPPMPDAILDFANKHGRLTREPGGDTLDLWQRELAAMKRAVDLWDRAEAGNVADLVGRFHWTAQRQDEEDYEALFGESPPVLDWREQHIRAARAQVKDTINQHQEGLVSPALLWRDYTTLDLYFVPSNLLGALWLQFAEAIAGHKKYRKCQECETWFAFDPDKARRDKVFCSNACRNRAWRRRQGEQAASPST